MTADEPLPGLRWVDTVCAELADRVLLVTHAAALAAARITMLRSRGDGGTVVAATALVKGLPVVTRNVEDFADVPGNARHQP